MITDAQIVDAVAELYGADPQFDDLLWPDADAGVAVALRRYDDIDLVIFRGSTTGQDWERDLMAVPMPSGAYPQIGWVHPGFLLGLDQTFAHIKPLLRGGKVRTVVSGHSLGAGRASQFGGLLIAADPSIDVEAVIFGEPRSGCRTLRTLWAPKPYRSYRNADPSGAGHDMVTDVPTMPPYCQNRPLIDVFGEPSSRDPWLLLKYHHIQLYQEGVKAMERAQ